jgi:electron transfer flavoprotein alpha subunit
MASVLVHIAAKGARPSPASAAALTLGRRIASELGATLHVAAPLAEAAPADELITALGRAGADKIELVPPADPGPARWSRTGPVLVELCRQLAPRLVLLGAGDGLADLAARLAASLGATYFPDGQLCGERREPALERYVEGRRAAVRLRLFAQRGPLVATVAGPAVQPGGEDDDLSVRYAEQRPDGDGIEWLGRMSRPRPPLDQAATVVGLGAGASLAEVGLAEDLARALGGELAGTETACRQGLVAADRAIGLGAARIAPRLYLSLAASGSRRHLAGLGPTTTIVALNRDAGAPIFRAARYGMVGELARLIPELIGAVGGAR